MDQIAPPSPLPSGKTEKQDRIDRAIRKKLFKKIFWITTISLLIFAIIALGVYYARTRNQNLPGVLFIDQGRDHVGPDHHHTYNSNPPTSGWHDSNPANWGVYHEELRDEVLIHNLEHGGIWISYRPGIPDEIKKKLEHFYDEWGAKIIVTPRAKNDTDIALAAWTRLDKFDIKDYSDVRVETFIKRLRNVTAPEPYAP